MSTRVSSNLTLVLKIFIPTCWTVFFGLLTLAIVFASGEDNPFLANWTTKLIAVCFFIIFFTIMYFTIMKLLRVEFSEQAFSASNYFQTYQYKYEDIEEIKEYDLLFKVLVRIKMKGLTKYGYSIYFLKSKAWYNDFVKEHPQIFAPLITTKG